MLHPKDDTKYAAWATGVDKALRERPAPWNIYDFTIKGALAAYTAHLKVTPGFIPVDWQMIKAILWTETNALSPFWLIAPMQCGVNGDPGLGDLLRKPAGALTLPPEYAGKFNENNVPNNPTLNIQAGIGVVMLRMSEHRMVPDAVTAPGSALISRVAPAHRRSNPSLPPGMHYAVTGWRRFNYETLSLRYNGGGDGNYPRKLQHCYEIITGKVTL